MTVRRNLLAAGCALVLGFGFASLPVSLGASSGFGTGIDAQAAPAKKKKAKASSKSSAKASAKSKSRAKPKTRSKSAAASKGKKVAVKEGRSSTPSQAWLVDPDQLAPGTVDEAGSKPPVEVLADYGASLRDDDFETAAVLLRLLHGTDPDRAAINTANDLVGIKLDTEDTAVLLELSSTARTEAAAKIAAQKSEPDVKGPTTGERVGTAHDVIATASSGSALICLSAYKRAMGERDAEAAAFSLTCASRGQVEPATAARINAVLNIPAEPAPKAPLLAGTGQIPTR
jgi:hypothetical protein